MMLLTRQKAVLYKSGIPEQRHRGWLDPLGRKFEEAELEEGTWSAVVVRAQNLMLKLSRNLRGESAKPHFCGKLDWYSCCRHGSREREERLVISYIPYP